MNAVLEAREPSARYLAELEPPLLGQFDLLATAPNGVARLRELILSLAVQGKLVPQDPNDEPTSVLLERIWAEKARLVKEGKIRTGKPLSEITEEEKAFKLPEGWEWVRLGQVMELVSGQHLVPSEYSDTLSLDIPYLTGPAEFGALHPIPSRSTNIRRAVAIKGDILVTVKGSGVGKLNVVSQAEIAISRQLMAIRPIVLGHRFLFLVLSVLGEIFQGKSIGIAIPGIGRDDVSDAAIALPPLTEQSRIVARVEELMALCDALEAKGKLEAEQHARLVDSLFESLANSESAHAVAENWQRIATHFDLLLDRPAAVDTLEQTILQLAVRGLLVPQNPADEPASALLRKIRVEKDRLIDTGQLKHDKPLSPISDEEKPFELPEGWEWVRCGEYFQELCTGPFGSVIHKEDYVSDGIPLINPSHMIDGEIIPDFDVSVPTDMALRLSAYRLSAGDVVLARRGEMGRFALVTEREDGWLCGTGSFFAKLHVECNRRYLALQLLDPRFRQHLLGQSVGSTMVNMNQRTLLETLVAIPPLAEQSRIVARVAELRTLCAQLRERLAATAQTQSRLAATLIEKPVA
jgi:type I restriction enzyme S subunit